MNAITRVAPDAAALDAYQRIIVGLVRSPAPDLSARQTAVLMLVARTDGPHTVRGLAAALRVAKPVITRALDRLEELHMLKRSTDPNDRRSVLIICLSGGRDYIAQIAKLAAEAGHE